MSNPISYLGETETFDGEGLAQGLQFRPALLEPGTLPSEDEEDIPNGTWTCVALRGQHNFSVKS